MTLEPTCVGSGEPVLFIHGGLVCDPFASLLGRGTLADYQTITYRRRGYGGDGLPPEAPISVAQHASDALGVLHTLGTGPAHIVGYAYGGLVAIEMAVIDPQMVHTLTLLEADVSQFCEIGPRYVEEVFRVLGPYLSSDPAGEIDERGMEVMLDANLGPNYISYLTNHVGPNAFALALADAIVTFRSDGPSMAGFELNRELLDRVEAPVLNVSGSQSDPNIKRVFGVDGLIQEHREVVREFFPHSEEIVLDNIGHALMMQDPDQVAQTLASFFARHPVPPHGGE